MLNSLQDIEFIDNQRFLGEGAFSKVYRVRSKINNKQYALKIIDITQLSKSDRDNLKIEIKLHKSLNHPNIINYVDALQIGNKVFILLEFAENGCLFFYIHLQNGIPEKLAIRYLVQTTLAIKHLHEKNLIHRDIKPENILLDENLNVKICDFGWSCQTDKRAIRTSVCGTVEYMSPEIVQKGQHSFKTDLWCLGILFYEMLHGQTPFKASSMQELSNELVQKDIKVKKNFSEDSKYFLRNLLQHDERNRYDIDQLVQSPVFQKYVYLADKKLSLKDVKILKENYLLNCRSNQRVMPQFIERFDQIYQQFETQEDLLNKTEIVEKEDDFFDDVDEKNVSFFDVELPVNISMNYKEMNFFKDNKNDEIQVNKVKGNEIKTIQKQMNLKKEKKQNENDKIIQDQNQYENYTTQSSNTQTFNVYQKPQQQNSFYYQSKFSKPKTIKINVGDEYNLNCQKLGLKKIRSQMNLDINKEEDSFDQEEFYPKRESGFIYQQHQSFRSQREIDQSFQNDFQQKNTFKNNLNKLLQNFNKIEKKQNFKNSQNYKNDKNFIFKTYNQSVNYNKQKFATEKSQYLKTDYSNRVSFNSNIEQKKSISFRNVNFYPIEKQSTYNDFDNTNLSKKSESQKTFSTLATLDPNLKKKFDKMFNEIRGKKNELRFNNKKFLTKIKQFIQ